MITIGSGGVIIEEGRVLLIKRINSETFDNIWSNPGGKVEEGESLEDACVRELSEELGIDIGITKQLGSYEDFREGKLIGIYAGFLVEINEGVPRICEPDKIGEIKYWPLNSLPENLTPYTLQYLRGLI
jgi:8-oxo-dGTP diphosphatase